MSVYRVKATGRFAAQTYDRGKKIHLGTYATKREALAVLRDYENRPPMSAITVTAWRDRWLATPKWKESTRRHNTERTLAFNREHGERRLADVNRTVAREWAEAHPSSQMALSAMFGAALYEDDERGDALLRSNPFARLARKTQARRDLQPDWLRAEGIAALERAAIRACGDFGKQAAAMIRFAAETGVRPGELFVIEWGDLRGETLLIRQAIDSKSGVIGTPKNGRKREVTLSRAAIAAASQSCPRLGIPYVFPTPTGVPFRTGSWGYYWRQIRQASGLPAMDFYSLRHYCATRLLEANVPDWQVAVQLGHTDGGELVRKVYGHPSDKLAREAVRRALNGEEEAA